MQEDTCEARTLHRAFTNVDLQMALVDGCGCGRRGGAGDGRRCQRAVTGLGELRLVLEPRATALAVRQCRKLDDRGLEVGERALHQRTLALVIIEQMPPHCVLCPPPPSRVHCWDRFCQDDGSVSVEARACLARYAARVRLRPLPSRGRRACLGEQPRVANDNDAVACSRQRHVEPPWVVQEADALGAHARQDDVVLLTALTTSAPPGASRRRNAHAHSLCEPSVR